MTTPTPEKILCPVCGSVELTTRNDKRTIGDRFTGSILIDEIIYVCSSCGAEGDFANQNDDTYKRAVEAMSATAMSNMFEALNAKGITSAELERKLSLPQRTTARWKRDGASAAATTLIKTVITYPWMLDVAKTNFDPSVANQTLMLESFKLAENWAKSLHVNSNRLDVFTKDMWESLDRLERITAMWEKLKESLLERAKGGKIMRHSANHDEMRTNRQSCECGHLNGNHEIHPDRHCYLCSCKEFKLKRVQSKATASPEASQEGKKP